MRLARLLMHSALRRCYYLAMYSGLRALVNRMSSRFCALDPRLKRLDGARVGCHQLGDFVVHVHPRVRPRDAKGRDNHGLFSLRQIAPDVGRWTYRFFCSTSHLGCGHVEVAFFERAGTVTFYAIRNIASANARRLGLAKLSTRFRLSRSGEDTRVLRLVSSLLAQNGFVVAHAPAQDCIDLSVDDRLLPLGSVAKVKSTLYRKYEKLGKIMAVGPA